MQTKILAVIGLCFAVQSAMASIRPSLRHDAGKDKQDNYIEEGFFSGGDKSVTSVKLTEIRRGPISAKQKYERVVLQLQPQSENSGTVPHFLVQAAPAENRFVVSIWADVSYDFDRDRVAKDFAKSKFIKRVNVLPRVEDGIAMVEVTLNEQKGRKPKVEVFRLSNPPRIIMDIL